MDSVESKGTRVLVSAASKHGATAEIAERIGAVLRERGLAVEVADPVDVVTIDGYDALVMGSAVYAGHWMESARSLAGRIAETSPTPPVWLFSSGPIGDPPKPEEDPLDVATIIEATHARDHRVLSGKIDKSTLSFTEKAILVAVRSPEGDFRDWDEIEAWADEIADALEAGSVNARKDPERTNDSGGGIHLSGMIEQSARVAPGHPSGAETRPERR